MKHTDSLKLSIIIPVAPRDDSWKALLQQLAVFAPDHFWILSVSDEGHDCENEEFKEALIFHHSLSVVSGAEGRADQINRAILTARTEWIWVLQADAELSLLTLAKLLNSLLHSPDALHYFESSLTREQNRKNLGQKPRPGELLKPLGNLGFAFHRRLWLNVGEFPQDLSYGEDHVFVWRLKQSGFHLARVPLMIGNSPRKYETGGWLHTSRRILRTQKNRRQRPRKSPLEKS